MNTLVVISDKMLVTDALARQLSVKQIYQVSSSVEYLPVMSGQLHPDLLLADMDYPLSKELISLSCCELAQRESCQCFFLAVNPEQFETEQLRSLTGRWLTPDQLESLPLLLNPEQTDSSQSQNNNPDFVFFSAALG